MCVAGVPVVVDADDVEQLPVDVLDRQRRITVAVIKPPDHATRVAILRKRVALDRIPVADETVLELIADRITDNVRISPMMNCLIGP